jgi:very-short-patch-repair endonuclease
VGAIWSLSGQYRFRRPEKPKVPGANVHKQEPVEMLVAIMHDPHDFAILQDQLWYRVPIETAPKRWPPEWLAFYQTKVFGEEAFGVRHFGRVREIKEVKRRDLFPSEIESAKSNKDYYQVFLERIETLPSPIVSARWRRIVFIPTSWRKFSEAAEINDLYDDSSLEDELWREFKRHRIPAERQWLVAAGNTNYILDFAVFCKNGSIDVEADGASYHLGDPKQAQADNRRNNELARLDWYVFRYTTQQICSELTTYCIPEIKDKIKRLGGFVGEEHIPYEPVELLDDDVMQLTLFGGAVKPKRRRRR